MISVKSTIGCNSLSYSSNIAMITSIILNINDRMSEHMSDRIPEMWDRMSERMPKNIWLVVYLPLLKIWVRQLGLLFPIYGKIQLDVGQNGRPRGPQMLVYFSINHPIIGVPNFDPYPIHVPNHQSDIHSLNPPQRSKTELQPPGGCHRQIHGHKGKALICDHLKNATRKSRDLPGENGRFTGKIRDVPRKKWEKTGKMMNFPRDIGVFFGGSRLGKWWFKASKMVVYGFPYFN